MDRGGSIDLIDAAIVVHGIDGKVRFEETADPSGKKLAKRGAAISGRPHRADVPPEHHRRCCC